MHHQIVGTTAMDAESHMAPASTTDHHGAYSGASSGGGVAGGSGSGGGGGSSTPASAGPVSVGDSPWVDMSPYAQTTMPGYGGGFGFGMGSMPPHGLPSESLGLGVGVGVALGGMGVGGSRMMLPPPPQVPQQHAPPPPAHPHQGHPQLHPLIMPSHPTWPSQLLDGSSGYSAPPIGMPPLAVPPLKASKVSPSHGQPTPRKTLTDSDRRAMCEYAEANPSMKQTEIGAKFGVERSTVSKVLRQKDKFLNPDERSGSPIKRSAKGKTADIEKALTNWLRNRRKSGMPISDADIRDQERVFVANTSGLPDTLVTSSHTWLEKFKQKNGLGGGPKLMRRASETNIPHSSSIVSPASPHSHHADPACHVPLSASHSKSDDEREVGAGGGGGGGNRASTFMDFTPDSGSYRHTHNQSSASLASSFTDTAASSSFSASALSPTPFTFSPDPNAGAFLGSSPGGANFQRPRSQTFPTLDIELVNQPPQGAAAMEPVTPRYHHAMPSTAPSSALESPMHEMLAQPFAIDTSVSSVSVTSPHLHRSSSSSSLAPPRSATTGTPVTSASSGGLLASASTPAGSSPGSPTQEDARRAADTLLSFIQQNAGGFIDQNDYLAVVRLTEKLGLHHHQQLAKAAMGPSGGGVPTGMGGLTRIPEGEVEMTNAPSPIVMPKMEPTTMSA